RLNQHRAAAQDRPLQQRILIAPLGKLCRRMSNRAVGFTHGDGVGVRGSHHDAFNNGLTAYYEVSFVCAHVWFPSVVELKTVTPTSCWMGRASLKYTRRGEPARTDDRRGSFGKLIVSCNYTYVTHKLLASV